MAALRRRSARYPPSGPAQASPSKRRSRERVPWARRVRVSSPPSLEATTGTARRSTDQGQNLLEHLLGGPAVAVGYLRGAPYRRVIRGVVAHQARQLHGALRAPEREPLFRDPIRELLVRDGGPEYGPGARDDAPDVVASAARGDPAALAELVGEVVDPPGNVLVEPHRRREVREGVEGVGVAAVLGEDEVGLEGPQHLRDDGLEAGDKGLVA